MWSIMKLFNILPNHPLLKTLTIEQRDFILLSMKQDMIERDRVNRGVELDNDFSDSSYEEEVSKAGSDWKIMKDGQDPVDIYKQVVSKTYSTDYEDKLDAKIQHALTVKTEAKKKELQDISDYQSKQIDMALQKAKLKEEQNKKISEEYSKL